VEDVTTRSELESRLASAENMAAVGRLAARVAHELNNPIDGTLRYINLCARLLKKQAEDASRPVDVPKLQSYLDHAREGLVRMTRIVADLLEFSRNTPMLSETGNINRVVEESIQSLSEHADRNGVIVMADFHDDGRMPALEGTKLFQVCCNLVKNAIDAMPDGGRLTIRTGIVEAQVVIRVEDTGVGLPPDAERVFEPFYTTKPPGQGTGLGLAICREYIEQLGGTVTAERGEEQGTVLTIRIPLSSCDPG
jgi:two-component system NtrC family sensor kinase